MKTGTIYSSKDKLVVRFKVEIDRGGNFALTKTYGDCNSACKRSVKRFVQAKLYKQLLEMKVFYADLTITLKKPESYTFTAILDNSGFCSRRLDWDPVFESIGDWVREYKHLDKRAYLFFEVL